MNTQSAQRDSALDAGRGILMLLGVVLHAANVYTAAGGWLVKDPAAQSGFFDVLVAAIHSFRMPAFFVISGFFTALIVGKRGASSFLLDRVRRVGIPLLFVWWAINPLQLASATGQPIEAAFSRLPPPLYHLWFLIDLMFMAVVAYPLVRSADAAAAAIERRAWTHRFWIIAVAAVAAGFVISAAVRATGLGYKPILGLTTLDRLIQGGLFYWFGMVLFRSGAVRRVFLSAPYAWMIVSVAAGTYAASRIRGGGAMSEVWFFLSLLASMVSAAVVMRACYALFGTASRFTRAVAETSYSVYLLHHFFVVVGATWLIGMAWPVGIKYLALVGFALGASLLLHYLAVARFRPFGLLLNGRWDRRAA
jgi:glucan biosynthesis protein C